MAWIWCHLNDIRAVEAINTIHTKGTLLFRHDAIIRYPIEPEGTIVNECLNTSEAFLPLVFENAIHRINEVGYILIPVRPDKDTGREERRDHTSSPWFLYGNHIRDTCVSYPAISNRQRKNNKKYSLYVLAIQLLHILPKALRDTTFLTMLFGQIDDSLRTWHIWAHDAEDIVNTREGAISWNCSLEIARNDFQVLSMCSIRGKQRRRFQPVAGLCPEEGNYGRLTKISRQWTTY
jgi:hypothetical protein